MGGSRQILDQPLLSFSITINYEENEMKWDKRGNIISGTYEGVSYAGRVSESRVNSDGNIAHTIELFEPIDLNGSRHYTITIIDMFLNNVSSEKKVGA